DEPARALLAGVAAHSTLPLERAVTAAFGLVLTVLGHAVGWPVVRGGTQRLADALAVHLRSLGGVIETEAPVRSLRELPPAASERSLAVERPFVLVAQPTVVDPSRAPNGRHTAWAYCHVPNRWTGDATAAIEAQLERFAPGFRDVVLARVASGPADLERRNAN